MIVFLWKISQGLVSGYDLQFSTVGTRRGRIITPKPMVKSAPTIVKNARERSIAVKGVQLFNLLPESLKGLNSQHVDLSKNHLDVFLSSIPDQLTVTGLISLNYLCFTT